MVGLQQAGEENLEAGLSTGVLTDVLLPLGLAIIMLGMGLGLRWSNFTFIAKQPRGVIAGLTGQLLLLPLAGALVVFLFTLLFDLETELAIGLLLLAAVPGGATSNMLTWLARGDTALSVTLTAITSVGSFLLTPLVLLGTTSLLFADASSIVVPFGDVLKLTLAVVAGPVVIGMLVGHRWPRLAAAIDRPLRVFSILFLAVLIAGIIFQNREGFWGFAAATVPASLVLNVLALGSGFLVAWAFRLSESQRRAAVIEVGFQNGTFAILLAVTQLGMARAALMPGFYSLVMYATGGLLAVYWIRRGNPALAPAVDPRVPLRPLARTPKRPLPVPSTDD